jgi:hypothetical protein
MKDIDNLFADRVEKMPADSARPRDFLQARVFASSILSGHSGNGLAMRRRPDYVKRHIGNVQRTEHGA